jgi:hypothetical protein
LDELDYFVIDDDGDIEIGFLFAPIYRKKIQVGIVSRKLFFFCQIGIQTVLGINLGQARQGK